MRNSLVWADVKIDLTERTKGNLDLPTRSAGLLPDKNVPQIDLTTKVMGKLAGGNLDPVDLSNNVKGVLNQDSLPGSSQVTYLQFDGGNASTLYTSDVLRFDMGHAS